MNIKESFASLVLAWVLTSVSPTVQAGIDEVVFEASTITNTPMFDSSKLEKQTSSVSLKEWQKIHVLYRLKSHNGKEVGIFLEHQYNSKMMKGYELFSYPGYDGQKFSLFVTQDVTHMPATGDFSTFIIK